ncbi:MAG: hypothetical protein KDI09_18780 [Halioglobus sp.]|nr:hypothetical protein [Halioglobus sp.]
MSAQNTPLFQPLRPPKLTGHPDVLQPAQTKTGAGELQVEDDAEYGTDPYNTARLLVAKPDPKS